MKTSLLILSIIFVAIGLKAQTFVKLKESDASLKQIEIAQTFANNYLTLNKNSMPYLFKDEAIDALKMQLTPETQSAIYAQIKNEFGDFESLVYSETWIDSSNPIYKVFRFKGTFAKSTKKLEVRVVLDNANKISGFWLKPWSDMFN